jgi:hypothetical protein
MQGDCVMEGAPAAAASDPKARTPQLRAYLAVEKEMLAISRGGTDDDILVADILRDALDLIWLALDDDEYAFLNARGKDMDAWFDKEESRR